MITRWVCLFFFLLAPASAAAQQVSPHAQKAVEVIRQLRALGLPGPDELEAGPPAKVPGLLRQLNQELKALIVDDLNDNNRRAVPSETEIFDQLTAAGWEEIPSNKWSAYGEIRKINFDWKSEYEPGVLIVASQLWIPCGSTDPDSAIYVFQGRARHWQLVLAADADFVAPTNDGRAGIQYKLSPLDSRGHWFLALANIPPSCRKPSTYLRYQALRPGTSGDNPIVLISGRESINSFFQPPFRFGVDTNTFYLTLGKVRKLDGEPGISVTQYDFSNYQARRMAPLALSPVDFLDQWAQLKWDDAKRWTKASSDSALQEWHSKLNSLAFESGEIESAHLCSGTEKGDQRWLIQLSIDPRPNPSISEETLYVDVAKRGGIFVVDGVHESHPAGCAGTTPITPIIEPELPKWHIGTASHDE